MKSLPLTLAAVILAFQPLAGIGAQEAAVPDTESSTTLSSFKTADELWAHIEKLQRGPTTQPESRQEAVTLMNDFLAGMEAALNEFISRYPIDPRRWSARLILVDLQNFKSMKGGPKPDPAKLQSELTTIANAKDAPAEVKAMARLNLLGMEFQSATEAGQSADLPALRNGIDAFATDFPDHQAIGVLNLQYANLLQSSDPKQATALLEELKENSNPNVSKQAQALLSQAELKSAPLDLEFTAVDGSEVSLAKLRGKVVLLDFWATWCRPCVKEAPNVVATYNKLHEKGFEIIGISLDQNKDALEQFTAKFGMTWPQYFDGEGWKNKISTRFGIDSIPAMWLLDKKGFVVSTDARADLEKQVSALLNQ